MAKKKTGTTPTAAQVETAKRVRREIRRRPGAVSAWDRVTAHQADAVVERGKGK